MNITSAAILLAEVQTSGISEQDQRSNTAEKGQLLPQCCWQH